MLPGQLLQLSSGNGGVPKGREIFLPCHVQFRAAKCQPTSGNFARRVVSYTLTNVAPRLQNRDERSFVQRNSVSRRVKGPFKPCSAFRIRSGDGWRCRVMSAVTYKIFRQFLTFDFRVLSCVS